VTIFTANIKKIFQIMKKVGEKFADYQKNTYFCNRIGNKQEENMKQLFNAWWWRNSRFK